VALLADADRAEMVEMLGAGVAGLALRSLSAEALVATVRATAEAVAAPLHLAGPLVVPLAGPGPARRPAAPGSAENGLTPKEQEVLAQLARGASNKAIAEALFVTPATVKTHLAHIYAKLGAHGRKQALARALSTGRGQ
jgi:DNA-binding NarL/FixJ family response regulator